MGLNIVDINVLYSTLINVFVTFLTFLYIFLNAFTSMVLRVFKGNKDNMLKIHF